MTKKRQSDFRKIMGNDFNCESLDVLDDPGQYFDDNEDIDSVQMEVLKNLKKQMNPKYKKAAAEGNTDNRRLGQLPVPKPRSLLCIHVCETDQQQNT